MRAQNVCPNQKKLQKQGLEKSFFLLQKDMDEGSECLPKPKKVSNTQGLVLILLEDDMVGASGCFVVQKKTFTCKVK